MGSIPKQSISFIFLNDIKLANVERGKNNQYCIMTFSFLLTQRTNFVTSELKQYLALFCLPIKKNKKAVGVNHHLMKQHAKVK